MSNTIDPVDIEFALKGVNLKQEVEKVKAEIKGVTDTVQKEAVKMTKSMNDFGSQTSTQLKQQINIQKQAIKELQQQIKEYQAQVNSSTGKNKIEASTALATARRDLIAEQGALLAMQKQLTSGNVAEEKSQVSLIGSLGRWAVGLASVTAAMKIGKEIIESTEGTASRFEKAINASTAAVQYFFKAIASGDWSNFREGFWNSVSGAIKLTEQLERIERKSIESDVLSKEAGKQIATLREGTFDKGVENTDKLIENLTKIIEIEKADYARQAGIAKDKYEATRNQMAIDNKISADKLESLAFEYSKNEELIDLAQRYSNITSKVGTGLKADYFQKTRPEKFKELTAEMANLAAEMKSAYGLSADEAVSLAAKFEKPTLSAIKSLAELKKSQIELEGQSQIGSRRDENQLAAAINRKKTEQDAEAKRLLESSQALAKKQLDYETEIGRQRIANQIEIDQMLLNAHEDGAEKQRQQAELDFRKTLVQIANQKADQLKKLNEANGGIDLKTGQKTDKYISVLPAQDQAQIDAEVIAAEDLKNAQIKKINKQAADQIAQIWQEVTDYRLKGIDKEKAAVKDRYDEMEKAAKKADDVALLNAIPELRAKANADIERKYALEELDFQEKIEQQKNEIDAKGFNRQQELEKKNFDSWVAIQKKKVEILKKSPDVKDQQAATLLENEIEIRTEDRKANIRSKILDYTREITRQLSDQLGITQQQSEELQGIFDVLYNLGKGDYLAAGLSGASTIIKALFSGSGKEDATMKALENVNNLLERQSVILANLSGTNYFELAAKQYDDYGKSIDLNNKKLQDAKIFTNDEMKRIKADLRQFNEENPSNHVTLDGWKQQYKSVTDSWSPNQFIEAYVDGTIMLDQQQINWVTEITEKQKQRAELLQETFRTALGFDSSDVSDSIFSGIEEGLKLGENSLGDFAQSFGNLMKKALMQAITESVNMDITNNFLPKVKEFLQNDEVGPNGEKISPREQLILENLYADSVKKGKELTDAIKPILDKYGVLNSSLSNSKLVGSASAATEETVSAMVGQMMAIRVDVKEIVKQLVVRDDDMVKNLLYLKQIADNTSHNVRLIKIEEGITEMNRTMKERL